MDSTSSISKGCFAFKSKQRTKVSLQKNLTGLIWYNAYKKYWLSVQDSFQAIENNAFSNILDGLVSYVREIESVHLASEAEIPAAALLTGINMPDHGSLFAALSLKLNTEVSPHVAILWSRDCTSVRCTVERMCAKFMSVDTTSLHSHEVDLNEDQDIQFNVKSKIQRWQCTLPNLTSWYKESPNCQPYSKKWKRIKAHETEVDKKPLIIIIPDLETFSAKVLEDFVLLLSGYRKQLPFFLVFGVATAVSALHRSLPHHVSSCMNIKLFHSKPSSEYFSEILEKVFLTPERSLHLGGKTFNLLTEVFLCYDFSVTGFVQGFKYCLHEHFYGKNWTSLCCPSSERPSIIENLTSVEIQSLRELRSARKFVEEMLKKKEEKLKWMEDDSFVRMKVLNLLEDLHQYVNAFYATLKCLHIFTSSLPGSPLGKTVGSMYTSALLSDLAKSSALKESMSLLSFQSREELLTKLQESISLLSTAARKGAPALKDVVKKVKELTQKLNILCNPPPTSPIKSPTRLCSSPSKKSNTPLMSPRKQIQLNVTNRSQFKEKLKENASLENQNLSPFEELRRQILKCLLEDLFSKFLVSPCTKPFHEVMFYDDDKAVKSHIIGLPRQAVLRALKDPQQYLRCDCCKLSSPDEILPTLPDVCIVYKLHLESGRLINMYDWLQSFLTIVNPSPEEQREVDPKLQARFTRAVAELQFMGFIKSSTRKTDHVTRITWG